MQSVHKYLRKADACRWKSELQFNVAVISISVFGNENHCLRKKLHKVHAGEICLNRVRRIAGNRSKFTLCNVYKTLSRYRLMTVICFQVFVVYCTISFACSFRLQLTLMVLIGFILSNKISGRKLQAN